MIALSIKGQPLNRNNSLGGFDADVGGGKSRVWYSGSGGLDIRFR